MTMFVLVPRVVDSEVVGSKPRSHVLSAFLANNM